MPIGGSEESERAWYEGMRQRAEADAYAFETRRLMQESPDRGGAASLEIQRSRHGSDVEYAKAIEGAEQRQRDGWYNYYNQLKSAGTYERTDPATSVRAYRTPEQVEATSITSRRLNLLRQMLSGGQQSGIGDLRRNLAQRGMLDSGNLGAGISSIIGQTQGRLSEGTQAAAMGESEILLDLMRREKDRSFQRIENERNRSNQADMIRLSSSLNRQNEPSGIDMFLSGLGGATGQIVPSALYGMFSRGSSGGSRGRSSSYVNPYERYY